MSTTLLILQLVSLGIAAVLPLELCLRQPKEDVMCQCHYDPCSDKLDSLQMTPVF